VRDLELVPAHEHGLRCSDVATTVAAPHAPPVLEQRQVSLGRQVRRLDNRPNPKVIPSSGPPSGATAGFWYAVCSFRAPVRPLLPAFAALFTLTASTRAFAEEAPRSGSFFLFELSSGLSEPAYAGDDLGVSYGVSGGLAFKLKKLPLRFHFLTSFFARTWNGSGSYAGVPYSSARRDLDLFLAHRIALPIYGRLRAYGEIGLGHRWASAEVHRAEELPDLSVESDRLLLVVAAGLQLRLTDNVSIGVRGELLPSSDRQDVVALATGAPLTTNRGSLLAQLGLHF
jgi:opacity protein-like surface antigen